MTDYDLGRAHGRIVIEHDRRGFRRAEGAADDLSKSAHRVAEGFEDAGKAQKEFEKQTARTARAQENLNNKNRGVQKALNRLNEANEKANRLSEEGKKNTDEYRRAQEALTKAKNRYQEAVDESADAEIRYRNEVNKTEIAMGKLEKSVHGVNKELGELDGNLSSPKKLQIDTADAERNLRRTRREMEMLRKISLGAAGTTTKVGGGALLGGSALGLAGLIGGGATGAGAFGLAGLVTAIADMSGAIGVLPGAIGGLVSVIGTAKLGMKGFGEALEDIGTEDFAESLQKLAPEAQRAAISVASLKGAFDNMQLNIQNQLMQGWGAMIKDVGGTYLPILNKSLGEIANVLNFATQQFAEFLMQPDTQSDVKTFLGYVRDGFRTIAEAIKPALNAFKDIMVVSGSLLPDLSKGLGDALRTFADFTARARADGSMKQWFELGIEAVKQFGRAILNFSKAFYEIGKVSSSVGGGLLNWLEKISSTFLEWTQSAEGQTALHSFFESMTGLVNAMMPVLKQVGTTIFGTILPALGKLGENIAPGLLIFFQQLDKAFAILGEVLNDPQTVEALNEFLAVLGSTLLEIVETLGPEIPGLLKSFAKALTALSPILTIAAQLLVPVMQNLSGLFNLIASPVVSDTLLTIKNLVANFNLLNTALGGGWVGVWNLAKAAFKAFCDTFVNLGNDILSGLGDIVGGVWQWGVDMAAKIFEAIKNLPGDLLEKGMEAGKALIDGLKDGILDNLGPLGWVAKKMMETVSEYMPRSPAKKGPFAGQGYSKVRGRQLALDFAAGVTQGYGAANAAGSGLSESTASGIEMFVSDMLELSGFGQRVLSLVGDIMNNVFDAIDIFTTNPFTGESLFDNKGWKRTVSDEDLRRQREDKEFQDAISSSSSGDNVSRGPIGAELATTPLDLTQDSGREKVAKGIVSEAQRRGYSNEEAQAILSTAIQESGLDPTIWGGGGQWLGIFQQDASYQGREDPNKQVTEFFDRLGRLRASGGSSGDIWKDIFWLQQRPGEASADNAFANGRQNYLTEIQSQKNAAGDLMKDILSSPLPQAKGPIGSSYTGGGSGSYGLPVGTGINYGESGFPPWVYALAKQFNVQASTYEGHQEGSGQNRGIDWDGDPADLERLSRYLMQSPSVEQIIYENPLTGQRFGKDPGDRGEFQTIDDYYRDDWAGHRDHLHSRFNAPVGLPSGVFQWGGAGEPVRGFREAEQDRQIDNPTVATPLGSSAGVVPIEFAPLSEGELGDISQYTGDSVDQQEQMLNELRGRDPLLDQAIRIGQDRSSSDEQIASSLDYISSVADSQRASDTAQGRYYAGALDSVAGDIAGERGFTQPGGNALDTAAGIANGAVGVVGDVFKIIDGVLNSIGGAAEISETLVRGIENSEDLFKIVDEVQKFIDLAATISQTVTDGLGLAASIASVAGADPSGGGAAASGALSAAAAISGIVTSVISSINAAIDLGQEAYRIASKYVGKMLAYLVGAGQGSLMGDVHFLLDQTTGELKTWSGDNPQDKRTHQIPSWLQDKDTTLPGNKIRDLNMYVGPGTDPNEAMNAAMWSIRTDQSGVFASSGY